MKPTNKVKGKNEFVFYTCQDKGRKKLGTKFGLWCQQKKKYTQTSTKKKGVRDKIKKQKDK